jgi:hypothetical protein
MRSIVPSHKLGDREVELVLGLALAVKNDCVRSETILVSEHCLELCCLWFRNQTTINAIGSTGRIYLLAAVQVLIEPFCPMDEQYGNRQVVVGQVELSADSIVPVLPHGVIGLVGVWVRFAVPVRHYTFRDRCVHVVQHADGVSDSILSMQTISGGTGLVIRSTKLTI